MKMKTVKLIKVVAAAALCLAPATGYAKEISIDFGRTHSTTVTEARILDVSDDELKLFGQLDRPHPLPMAGHLHAYAYGESGELVSDSKHRVVGLSSQRGGKMIVPFTVSINGATGEIDRVFLEYHAPGHAEI